MDFATTFQHSDALVFYRSPSRYLPAVTSNRTYIAICKVGRGGRQRDLAREYGTDISRLGQTLA